MTEQQSLVSIVIPCYNHAQFVQESIQSVIDQDYENIELIIIDDGSRDNSVEIIQEMMPACEERFVRFEFRHRANKGLCATLNEAMEWCKGEYFSPLASDDIALSHKTRFLVNKIQSTSDAAVFGIIEQIGNRRTMQIAGSIIKHTFADMILQKNIPNAPAALMRTKKLKTLNGYDENVKLEDWYMWLKMSHQGETLTTYPVPVALYRRHEKNTVNDYKLMHKAREEIINNYENSLFFTKAIQKNYFFYAKELAFDSVFKSLFYLVKSRHINREAVIVFLKILTPGFIIKLKRRFSIT